MQVRPDRIVTLPRRLAEQAVSLLPGARFLPDDDAKMVVGPPADKLVRPAPGKRQRR